VKFVVLFSLASGAILDLVIGNKHAAELCLFRKLWQRLKAGTILLADRGFSDYGTLAELLATTLLDVKAYPRKMIEDLYLYRWRLELCLKDIKTTMGLETLRSKSPAMIQRCLGTFISKLPWTFAGEPEPGASEFERGFHCARS